MSVTVTVHGEHTAYLPPERATVHLTIGIEGPAADQAYAAAARSSEELTGTITPLHRPDSGPVTWWASDQVRTWAHRPWNQDGKQLPLVHQARVAAQVKFSDFGELSRWLSQATRIAGVSLDRVEWALTVGRRDEAVRMVRAEAVRVAQAKAQAYADALDLGRVSVVEIADAGMLGQGLHPAGSPEGAMVRAQGAEAAPDVGFSPQDIAVSASVDARFSVG